MKMPEGWKDLKRLSEDSTAIICTASAGYKIDNFKLVPTLMKEMAESLDELIEEHRDEFMDIRPSLQNAAAILEKFKDWER